MTIKIAIYEPQYKPGQIISDNKLFPLEVDNLQPYFREFKHLIKLYLTKKYLEADYTGLFSPKFSLKSKISAEEFILFVENNPGSDVYFINPFPQLRYISYNVWMQGEYAHPGITDIAQDLLDLAGVSIDLKSSPRNDERTLCYSNFWVASPNFWKKYFSEILEPIWQLIINNSTSSVIKSALELTNHTDPAPLLPFIIERLFSTYISINSDFKVKGFQLSKGDILQNYCNNDLEKILVNCMASDVDAADLKQQYSKDLVDKFRLTNNIFQDYFFQYFSKNLHPHTGHTIKILNYDN